ncbi:MAG TPA: ester cyclase, partial [Burkholderiales bacterium]|nr:ester cyclase [Burkholderiales bacterium]
MQPREIAQSYINAWNCRDGNAIIATFADGGSYSDPMTGQALTGRAIADYASGLWAAFPDLSFEVVSTVEADDGMIAMQWLMRGTNNGSFQGLPPTGRMIQTKGADFIRVEGDKIRSVQGYFDTRSVPEQLGLQVIVLPERVGPFHFGTSNRAQSGKRDKPGAFSITVLHSRSDAEQAQVKNLGRQIVSDLIKQPGFISWVGATIGSSQLTVTAWKDANSVRNAMQTDSHQKAATKFFGPELCASGYISVWVPERINPMWVRCPSCGTMVSS